MMSLIVIWLILNHIKQINFYEDELEEIENRLEKKYFRSSKTSQNS